MSHMSARLFLSTSKTYMTYQSNYDSFDQKDFQTRNEVFSFIL